jgi:hypothetical protein
MIKRKTPELYIICKLEHDLLRSKCTELNLKGDRCKRDDSCCDTCTGCYGYFIADNEIVFAVIHDERDIQRCVNYSELPNLPTFSFSHELDLCRIKTLYEYLKKHRYVMFRNIDLRIIFNFVSMNYDLKEDFILTTHMNYNYEEEVYDILHVWRLRAKCMGRIIKKRWTCKWV